MTKEEFLASMNAILAKFEKPEEGGILGLINSMPDRETKVNKIREMPEFKQLMQIDFPDGFINNDLGHKILAFADRLIGMAMKGGL